MGTITLEEIHKDILGLKKEISHIKALIQEDFELSDELVKEIKESRARPNDHFVSHEEMRKEFS